MRLLDSVRRKAVLWACIGLMLVAGGIAYPSASRTVRTYFAERALRERDGEAAFRWLIAIPVGSRTGDTHLLLAKAYRRLGQLDHVKEHLQIAWDRGVPVDCLEREQWLTLAQSGQMHEAEPHLRKLLQDPRQDGRDICECYVTGYLLNFQFPKAAPILAAWEAEFPDDPRCHELQGTWFQDAGRWSEAVGYYEKALQLNPRQTSIRRKMAVCLRELHEYDKAQPHFLQCLQETPDDSQLLVEWSDWLLSSGDDKQARSVLDRAQKLNPDDKDTSFALAKILLMNGAAQEAAAALQKLHHESPFDTEIQYSLASALQASGRTDEAEKVYQQVRESEEKLRRKQELIDGLDRNPDQPDVRYEIAMIAMNHESPVQGLRWLLSVVDLDPRHQASHAALAEYYQRIGKPELEERHRKIAESLGEKKSD